ncbi:hypothetical protein BJ912DRAFT_932373 [Pholiota molesta]|nr:hypothetical protein BJ912DRAFT_932373 [Pholiota molesta]
MNKNVWQSNPQLSGNKQARAATQRSTSHKDTQTTPHPNASIETGRGKPRRRGRVMRPSLRAGAVFPGRGRFRYRRDKVCYSSGPGAELDIEIKEGCVRQEGSWGTRKLDQAGINEGGRGSQNLRAQAGNPLSASYALRIVTNEIEEDERKSERNANNADFDIDRPQASTSRPIITLSAKPNTRRNERRADTATKNEGRKMRRQPRTLTATLDGQSYSRPLMVHGNRYADLTSALTDNDAGAGKQGD